MDLRPYYATLRATSLLAGFGDADLDEICHCFAPRVRIYKKGEILLLAGYENHDVGIVLEGNITAVKNTPDGTSVVITHMGPGGLFGDVLSGSSEKSPVTILAETDCTAVFLPYDKIICPCHNLHHAHLRLMQNLVATISGKYFALDRRVELLICKSLRERICIWLLEESARAGSDTFTTAFTRAGLAEYLNCDRSALSRELGRMSHEGLLETYRSSFKLLDKPRLQQQTPERSRNTNE